MMSKSKTRIWSLALVVLFITTKSPVQAPAASLKQLIVKCSAEDFRKVQKEVGAAVVDAMSGYYLINVPVGVDVARVESVRGKGSISASENSRLILHRSPGRTTDPSTVDRPPLGEVVDWYGTPAREAYS